MLWVKAVRAPFFTAAIIPVALGSVIAWHDTSKFNWFHFSLVMLGAIFMHAATNLMNDYFDHLSGCDEANPNPTPFSGGSRVIQDGLITPRKILIAALIALSLGSLIGLYLNYICGGNVILILGIIGVLLAIFYTPKQFKIVYGGFGEIAVGIGFGPLMVMGSYYVQAQQLPFKIFLASLPIGILIALILFINEFPDYAVDKTVGKNTLVVILGKEKAIRLYHFLLLFTYLLILSFVLYNILPRIALIVFLSLPLALRAFKISQKNFERVYELLAANASTIALHSVIGLLLCAGFILDKILFQ